MSGIAGIIHFDGRPVEPGLIEKMTGTMAHRGPDGIHHWVKGSVALGQCMLRTTPESLEEHQPLTNEDESLVLVFDGRLDNRDQLIRELRARRVVLRTMTDAGLVLHAYRIWGEETPQHLLGDFVYAIWDSSRQQLMGVRDHMGARPFYYASSKDFLAFASDDEALLGLPNVSSQPNEELIAHLLVPAFQSFDSRRSWLQDVLMLPPAHLICASAGNGVRIDSFWRLEPGEASAYTSDQECQDAFLEVFGEALRCRMRTTGNIGAMMSGGLDSAGIGAMVRRLLQESPGREFHTYSAVSDASKSCLESQCIETLTKDTPECAHFVSVPSFNGMVSVADLIDTAWGKAHPVDNSILLPAMMCLAASRNDERVLLHGVSGDLTMFVPKRYISYLMRDRRWLWAWRESREASDHNTFLRGSSPTHIWLSNAWTAYMPGGVKRVIRRIRGRGANFSQSVISRKFAHKLNLVDRLHLQERAESQACPKSIRQAHAELLNSPMFGIAQSLTGYEHVAGRFGVELRDPWADKRLVEFFLRLPLKYKIRDGWTKYLMRSAFERDFDPVVCWRSSKEHLGWHFPARLISETSRFISQRFDQCLELIDGYVDIDRVRARSRQYRTDQRGTELELVFDMMTLLLWIQRISTNRFANQIR